MPETFNTRLPETLDKKVRSNGGELVKFIDYYEVLQVSPTASFEVIKVAYRQLSKMYHPDTSNQEDKEFILIKDAYDILSDEYKRNDYDKLWRKNQSLDNSNNSKEEINRAQKGFSTRITKGKKATAIPTDHLKLIVMSILVVVIFIYILENLPNDPTSTSTSTFDADATSEIYSISLPKEDYSKLKTTESILDYGEAYFDIYNGTNLTISRITIEINVKNENGDIIDTRQFQKDVNIAPLTVEKEINITTGIEGLPAVGDNDLRIQPKYISWSYIDIIGDDLQ